MYRKIVDSVEWMTSSEQLAEYVRMFRYEYIQIITCNYLGNWVRGWENNSTAEQV